MSATHRAAYAPADLDAPAPVGILFNLPERLQTTEVLRALICAEHAGYLRGKHDVAAGALAQVRLSSSRPS